MHLAPPMTSSFLNLFRLAFCVSTICTLFLDILLITTTVFSQKSEKRGMTNTKMYAFLEQNIRVFLGLHKLTHGLTFGIIYFCKYYRQ